MKKVTTTIIAVAVVILLIISGLLYFGRTDMSQNFTLKGVDNSDGAVKAFLEMMIPHHEEAVAASKQIMLDPSMNIVEIKLLAGRIVDAQTFEIAQMKGWYQEWFGIAYVANPGAYTPMMSAVVPTNTRDQKVITYLEDMIMHHEHAVMAARDTRELIEKIEKKGSTTDGTATTTNSRPGIDTTLAFTKRIEDAQTKEIAEMKGFLKLMKK